LEEEMENPRFLLLPSFAPLLVARRKKALRTAGRWRRTPEAIMVFAELRLEVDAMSLVLLRD
jgi:hypothetical protein